MYRSAKCASHLKLLFTLISLTVLISCKKSNTIHIVAQNPVSGERYPGIEYQIVSKNTKTGQDVKNEKRGTLDNNGEDFIRIHKKRGRTYEVRLLTGWSKLALVEKPLIHFSSERKQNSTCTINLVALTNFRISVYGCTGMMDSTQFRLYYLGTRAGNVYTPEESQILQGYGCYNHPGTFFEEVPTGTRYYKWTVHRNGVTNVYYDSVTLSPNTYETYNIFY